jgi:glycerol-3-phosphate dehydrogenase (NAD(P)+)
MRIAVIGAGSWGTTVASMAARRVPTVLWARRPDLARAIRDTHHNPGYLPEFPLPEDLEVTADLSDAISGADVVIMAVPSHGYRAVLAKAAGFIPAHVSIMSLTKGIEQGSLLRMTEVTAELLTDHPRQLIGVMSGPNLAPEVMAGQPTATVVAFEDPDTARPLQEIFMSTSFRVYTNTDVVGCEIAGAVKNVMAIGAGMARGLGFGDNTLAALVTRALAELTRLGVAVGGGPVTFAGLAGMGDLIATCMSSTSRNNRVGYALGRGSTLDEILSDMKMVAEGVKSTKAVLELADRHGIEMPIAEQVGRVLYEGMSPKDAVLTLMTRAAKDERHGII